MTQHGKDYFRSLYGLAKVVNSSLEPADVLAGIVAQVNEALGVKACALRVLDRRRETLKMGACAGLSEGYVRKGPVTVDESGLDRKALAGETVYIADAQNDPSFQYGQTAVAEGIRSVLVAPLMVEGKAVGVLRVYADQVRAFDEEDIAFLEAAANLSAIALENARLHAALQRDYDLMLAHQDRVDDN